MTKLQRRKLYWAMYFIAVGLSGMTPRYINKYNDNSRWGREIPTGFCQMLDCMRMGRYYYYITLGSLPELAAQSRGKTKAYWVQRANWKRRIPMLLKAIELTY